MGETIIITKWAAYKMYIHPKKIVDYCSEAKSKMQPSAWMESVHPVYSFSHGMLTGK